MAGQAFTICPDVYTYADREHNKLTIEAETTEAEVPFKFKPEESVKVPVE